VTDPLIFKDIDSWVIAGITDDFAVLSFIEREQRVYGCCVSQ